MKSKDQVNPFELGQQHERDGVPSSRCPFKEFSKERVRYTCGRQSVKDEKRRAAQQQWAQGARHG